MLSESERPLSQEELRWLADNRAELDREFVKWRRKTRITMGLAVCTASVFVAIAAGDSVALPFVGVAAAITLPIILYVCVKDRRPLDRAKQELDRCLEENRVVEKLITADGAVAFPASVGAMHGRLGVDIVERGWFAYDIGEGRLFLWEAIWSHYDDVPAYPRRSLRIVLRIDRIEVMDVKSEGDLIETGRRETAPDFSSIKPGTVIEGTLATVESDIQRHVIGIRKT